MTTTNPLASYFSSLFSTGGATAGNGAASASAAPSAASARISARVEAMLAKQNTVAPKINAQLTVDQTKLSALGQLQSALADFQAVAQSMAGSGLSASANSSASGVLTALSSATATAGSYAVKVGQLASSQVLATAAQSSASAAIGSGAATTIKIDFGTSQGSSFAASGNGIAITIDNGNNSLDGIAAAINGATASAAASASASTSAKAGAGVTARVVKGADGYQLELTSPSGAAGSMRIGVSGDSALRSLLAYDPAGSKNLSASADARDALLVIDGKQLSSGSNTVTSAIDGVSLQLKSTGSSTVTVARDNSQIAANVGRLLTAYNTLNEQLTNLKQGDLKTTNAVRNIQSQLAAVFPFGSNNSASSGDTGITLATLGITRQGNGNLALDSGKLQAAVNGNADGVSRFFTNGSSGVADKLASTLRLATGQGGSVKQAISSVNADISSLSGQKAAVEAAMKAKGNALMKFYTDQANGSNATSGMLDGISTPASSGTLLDLF